MIARNDGHPGVAGPAGGFLAAVAENRRDQRREALARDILGAALWALVEENGWWSGTAADLLAALEKRVPEDRRGRTWPRSPWGMRSALDRLAPLLRGSGVEVIHGRDPARSRDRIYVGGQPPEPSGDAREARNDGNLDSDGCGQTFSDDTEPDLWTLTAEVLEE